MEELTFNEHVARQATYLVVWVYWLLVINFTSVVFAWKHVEARWVLLAMLANMPIMMFMFNTFGWTRILGLPHVIVWTPLLVYLWLRRKKFDYKTPFGVYISVLFITNAISLAIDYSDVIRYLIGDGKLP